MNLFYFAFAFILLFSGCSHQNAFSKFNLDKQQELALSSIQSGIVESDGKVEGFFFGNLSK